MSNSFDMSNWRRKYVLMAENDNDPKSVVEYTPELHGKITSYEDVYFEPEEEPTDVLFTVGAENDLEDAKEIHVPFVKLEEWVADENDYKSREGERRIPFETEQDYRDAAIQYFDAHFYKHLDDEGKKSLHAQLRHLSESTEEPAKKPTKTEVVDQIKHFLKEKY